MARTRGDTFEPRADRAVPGQVEPTLGEIEADAIVEAQRAVAGHRRVADYDPAIAFFVGALGFELVVDSPAQTSASRHPQAKAGTGAFFLWGYSGPGHRLDRGGRLG